MIRASISLLLSVFLFTACSGGGGDSANDASNLVADADPNASDADPNAPDASANGISDAGSVSDATVGAADAAESTAGIECGEETCNEATQECCFMSGALACVAQNSCAGTPSTCDGPEDCGGDICCGSFSGASCSLTCEGNAAELCHTPSDCTTSGDMCCPVFGSLSVCRATCNGGGF